MTVWAILAGMIRSSLVMISSTARIQTARAIGDDGADNQVGMAPGAKWIGCRNMDQGDGTPARYIECMEFFLAPYPLNCTPNEGDPTKAPDITINSWGCPASEGCVDGDELRAAVEAQEAAGIQMVVAAGNSGSGCSTVSDPPSFYAASYTVGALTMARTLSLALAAAALSREMEAIVLNLISLLQAPTRSLGLERFLRQRLCNYCQRDIHGDSAYCRRHGAVMVGHSQLEAPDPGESRRLG